MTPRQLTELRSQLYRLRTWRHAPWHWVFARSFHDGILIFRLFRDSPSAGECLAWIRLNLARGRPIRGRVAAVGGQYLLRTTHHDAAELKRALTLPVSRLGLRDVDPWFLRGDAVPVDAKGDPRHPHTWRPDRLHERRVGDAVVLQAPRTGRAALLHGQETPTPMEVSGLDTLDPPAVPPPLPPALDPSPPPRSALDALPPLPGPPWMEADADGLVADLDALEPGDAAAAGPDLALMEGLSLLDPGAE